MVRVLFALALLTAALVAAPLAAAETQGSCIHHRGATGISVTLAHCIPDLSGPQELVERVDEVLCDIVC